MGLDKSPSTNDYWAEFVAATGNAAADYTVVACGVTAAMADELVALILSGRKRATVSLLRDYATGSEAVPQAGDFVMVVDGGGRPKCIWRTTEIMVKPLNNVDDAFAWDEGEGDRTRDWWLSAPPARAFCPSTARGLRDVRHDRNRVRAIRNRLAAGCRRSDPLTALVHLPFNSERGEMRTSLFRSSDRRLGIK